MPRELRRFRLYTAVVVIAVSASAVGLATGQTTAPTAGSYCTVGGAKTAAAKNASLRVRCVLGPGLRGTRIEKLTLIPTIGVARLVAGPAIASPSSTDQLQCTRVHLAGRKPVGVNCTGALSSGAEVATTLRFSRSVCSKPRLGVALYAEPRIVCDSICTDQGFHLRAGPRRIQC